jgi:N-acetyl-anhydromuramyl-L-alanine amidase AmpD
MQITGDSPFKSAPRISRARFARVVRERANPGVSAERDPGAYWDAIVQRSVDPLFILAMFNHESSMGKAGVAVTTHSWGNTRTPNFGATPIGSIPGRTGTFPVWRDWLDGCISTVARLVAPSWVYAERTAIREIFDHPSGKVWAPAGDLNSPDGYLRAMLDFMNQYADGGEAPVDTLPRPVMISLPSPNRGGYSTPRVVEAIVEHIATGTRASNLDWLTKAGSGASANFYVARDGTKYELVPWQIAPWTNGEVRNPDMSNALIRKWVENKWNPNTRVVTIENEGNPADTLTPAQMASNIEIIAWVKQEAGIQISRATLLGHYQIDSVNRPYCPSFSDAEWRALIDGANAVTQPEASEDEVTLNGFRIYGGIFQAWKKAGGLSGPGLPISEEMDGASRDATRIQWYERGVAEWRPGQWPDNFDVTWGLVGQELYLRLLTEAA